MKTLVIGDLHFNDKPMGMLDAQKEAIIQICKENADCSKVIFLGDLMMHRHPRPTVLLALKEVMDEVSKIQQIYILRGNHDSVNKSDDGSTILSMLEKDMVWGHRQVRVITKTWIDKVNKWVFIPHYEDDEKIKSDLRNVPENYMVFGHFGYNGVLDCAGDADFGVTLSDFKNPTILGHIHRESHEEGVSILGTPYSTNFGEAGKDCYYGILTGSGLEKIPTEGGPRHLVMDYDKVEENLDWINAETSPPNYTLLRININTINEDQDQVTTLCDSITAPFVEIKYKPLLDEKEEFETDNKIFTTAINDELIEHYINSSNASINKADLLSGLKLIHENQQNRDT